MIKALVEFFKLAWKSYTDANDRYNELYRKYRNAWETINQLKAENARLKEELAKYKGGYEK